VVADVGDIEQEFQPINRQLLRNLEVPPVEAAAIWDKF
jgi:hypothetical protein